MNKRLVAIVILSIILVVIWGYFLYLFFNRPIWTKMIEVSFQVGPFIGVNLSTSELAFGTVLAPSETRRTVFINNKRDEEITLEIEVGESVFAYLNSNQSVYVIPAHTGMKIPFNLEISRDTPHANYTGFVKFVARR